MTSTDGENDGVELVRVGEPRDEEGGGEIGNEVVENFIGKGVEVIVGSRIEQEVVNSEE